MRIIYLNGPPQSGKDATADILAKHYKAKVFKHTTPMDRALQSFINVSDDLFRSYRNQYKDVPLKTGWMQNGRTFRQCLIRLSEDWAKPTFGEEILGNLLLRELRKAEVDRVELAVISDSGFAVECRPVVAAYGRDAVLLVHLHRDGCTFEGDSRSYIELDGVTTVEMYNNLEGLDMLHARVKKVIVPWLENK